MTERLTDLQIHQGMSDGRPARLAWIQRVDIRPAITEPGRYSGVIGLGHPTYHTGTNI